MTSDLKKEIPIISILICVATFTFAIIDLSNYYSNMLLHVLIRAIGQILLAASILLDAIQIYSKSKTTNKYIKYTSQILIIIGAAFIATSVYLGAK